MTGSGRDDVPRAVHDGMFKRLFSDPALAAEELRAVLPPALVASIDWPSMDPAPTSIVDPVFRQRTSDLVFRARFLGSGEVLLWLLEHQSTEDWWMLKRIVETKSQMWRHWLELHPEARYLPAIVPVVVYNGPRAWRAPRHMDELYGLPGELRDALGSHVLSCSFVLDDLCAITDEALRARRMDAYARVCLFAMARAAAEDFLDRLSAWQVELRLAFRTVDRERITSLLLYTFRVHRHTDPESINERIAAVVGPEHEEIMLSVADQLIQRGYDKGLEKGVEKGVEKGIEKGIEKERRANLLRVLGRRFGAMPTHLAARVDAASPAALDAWLDRAIDAATLDDIFGSE